MTPTVLDWIFFAFFLAAVSTATVTGIFKLSQTGQRPATPRSNEARRSSATGDSVVSTTTGARVTTTMASARNRTTASITGQHSASTRQAANETVLSLPFVDAESSTIDSGSESVASESTEIEATESQPLQRNAKLSRKPIAIQLGRSDTRSDLPILALSESDRRFERPATPLGPGIDNVTSIVNTSIATLLVELSEKRTWPDYNGRLSRFLRDCSDVFGVFPTSVGTFLQSLDGVEADPTLCDPQRVGFDIHTMYKTIPWDRLSQNVTEALRRAYLYLNQHLATHQLEVPLEDRLLIIAHALGLSGVNDRLISVLKPAEVLKILRHTNTLTDADRGVMIPGMRGQLGKTRYNEHCVAGPALVYVVPCDSERSLTIHVSVVKGGMTRKEVRTRTKTFGPDYTYDDIDGVIRIEIDIDGTIAQATEQAFFSDTLFFSVASTLRSGPTETLARELIDNPELAKKIVAHLEGLAKYFIGVADGKPLSLKFLRRLEDYPVSDLTRDGKLTDAVQRNKERLEAIRKGLAEDFAGEVASSQVVYNSDRSIQPRVDQSVGVYCKLAGIVVPSPIGSAEVPSTSATTASPAATAMTTASPAATAMTTASLAESSAAKGPVEQGLVEQGLVEQGLVEQDVVAIEGFDSERSPALEPGAGTSIETPGRQWGTWRRTTDPNPIAESPEVRQPLGTANGGNDDGYLLRPESGELWLPSDFILEDTDGPSLPIRVRSPRTRPTPPDPMPLEGDFPYLPPNRDLREPSAPVIDEVLPAYMPDPSAPVIDAILPAYMPDPSAPAHVVADELPPAPAHVVADELPPAPAHVVADELSDKARHTGGQYASLTLSQQCPGDVLGSIPVDDVVDALRVALPLNVLALATAYARSAIAHQRVNVWIVPLANVTAATVALNPVNTLTYGAATVVLDTVAQRTGKPGRWLGSVVVVALVIAHVGLDPSPRGAAVVLTSAATTIATRRLATAIAPLEPGTKSITRADPTQKARTSVWGRICADPMEIPDYDGP